MQLKEIMLALLGFSLVVYGALEVILKKGWRIHFPPPSMMGSQPTDPQWVYFYYWTKQRFWWLRGFFSWIIGKQHGKRFPSFVEKVYKTDAVYHGLVCSGLGILLLLLLWLDKKGFF